MVVVLNRTLQVFLKTSLLNSIFLLTNISMDAISSINPFLLRSVWFTITASTDFFLCITYHMLQDKILRIDNLEKSNVLYVCFT